MKYLVVLIGILSALEFGAKDAMDPGYLYWPKTQWNVNPISMTSNHAGDIADITFTFTPSTTLPSGILYVGFPSGFKDTSQIVEGVSFVSGEDISVTFLSVQLPNDPGVYGPISLMTRVSANGNIVDINKIFSTIPIAATKSVAKANSLQVSFDSTSSNQITSSGNLLFNFTLSQDLWKNDLLTISVDSHFTLTSPKCTSEYEYFTGVDDDLTVISCTFDSSLSLLYLYGLNVDIDLAVISSTGSLPMSFKVSGFTNPSINYPASDFNWDLVITRYATSTVIEQFTGNGPTVIPGSITVNYWKPHNGLASSEIVNGQILYMDLSLTTEHLIPSTGVITIVFSGIDILNTVWVSDATQTITSGTTGFLYINPYLGGTCTTTKVEIVCSNFENDINPGIIIVSTLSKFSGSSAKLISVTSTDSIGNLIDFQYIPTVIKFPISIKEQVLPYFSLQFASSNAGTYIADTMSSTLMYICFKIGVAVPASTFISITLPLEVNTIKKDFLITAGTSVKANLLDSATAVTDYSFSTGSLIALSDPVITSNNLTISLSSLSASIPANDYIYIYLTKDSISTLPTFALPRASTNTGTMYEATISFTISSIIYKASQVLTILPSSLGATATLLCTSTDTPGIPLTISFTPPVSYVLDSGSTLAIGVKFDNNYPNDLGSGISGAYPGYTKIDKVTFTLVSGLTATIVMNGLTSLSSLTTYTFAVPVGKMTASLNVDVMMYFLLSGRDDIEFVVMQNSISASGSAFPPTFASVISSTIVTGTVTASDPLINEQFTMEIAPFLIAGSYSTGYLGVILTEGFTISKPSVTLTTDTGIISTVLYYFTSSNVNFKFPSIYFTLSATVTVSTSTSSMTLSTLAAPQKSYLSSPYVILAPSTSATCIAYSPTNDIQVNPATLLEPGFTPDTVNARGPSSLSHTLTVSFTISYQISGAIDITLSSDWEITVLTEASIIGISSYTIAQSGNLFSVSGFSQVKASTSITLTLTYLSPPEVVGTYGHFDSIVTYMDTLKTQPVETWTNSAYDSCNVIDSGSTGTSTFKKVSVFPNAAGASFVYLNLEFSLTHSLPLTGTIRIYSALNYYNEIGDQSENCWFSVKYSSCAISDNVLIITLAEDYVAGSTAQLILDAAFDLPSTSGETTDGFAVISEYNGIIVDTDSLITFSSSQKLVINPAPYEVITMEANSLVVDPSTEGEFALYSFAFSVNTTVDTRDSFLFSMPYEYDAYLGRPVKKFQWGDPSSYYLNCSSFALSTVVCKVDHWNLIVTSLTRSLKAGTIIDLNVTYIKNPAYTGRIFNDIGLYLYNSNFIKAVKNDYTGILISQAGPTVRIRNITNSASKLQAVSDYTLEFYLDSTELIIGDSLIVQFPLQFNLPRDNSDNLLCAATWSDQSPTSLDRSKQTWNTKSTFCLTNGLNQVVWPVSEQKTFQTTDLVTFTIRELKNPEWGYTRTLPAYQGSASVFGNYDKWIKKFEIYCYSGKYFRYKSRSFYLEHSGFVGFYSGGDSATVNGFDPKSLLGAIELNPGSQTTDILITISSAHLFAKKLTFKPSNHAKNQATLYFTSVHDRFIMTRDMTSLNFRVSTSISSPDSLNYIEWVLEEVSLDGSVSPAYISPVTTLVEVYNNNQLSLSLGTINPVYLNTTSFPMQVSANNAPHTELIVALSPLDTSIKGLKFSPSALLFTEDVNELYFTVYVNSSLFTLPMGTSVYINFTLTGTDSPRFSSLLPQAFTIKEAAGNFGSQITLLTLASLTQTTLSIRVKLDSSALVYFAFGPSDLEFPSLSTLQSEVTPLESSSLDEISLQAISYFTDLDNTPNNGESWRDFQKRLYREFLRTTWHAVYYVDGGVTTDIFISTWQWAETSYTTTVYTDNTSGYYSSSTFTQSTSDQNPSLKVYVNFQSFVDSAYMPIVWNALALSLGVMTDLLTDPSVSSTSVFSWTFNADRASSLSPLTLVADFQSSIMISNLNYAGITSAYTFSYNILQHSDYQVPTWKVPPILMESGKDYALFNGSVYGTGQVCCIAENSQDIGELFSKQIYAGLGKNNTIVSWQCIDVANNTNYEMSLAMLESDTQYNLSCIACSAYPVWPDCMSNAASFLFNTTATVDYTNDLSDGKIKSIVLVLLVIIS